MLQFRYYTVNEIRFKDTQAGDDGRQFELHPEFNRTLTEQKDNQYDYTISVSVTPTEDEPAPFELYVCVTGHFTLRESADEPLDPKVKDAILKKNTAAILYPFLRSIVASVTVTADMPALLLPIVNFADSEE